MNEPPGKRSCGLWAIVCARNVRCQDFGQRASPVPKLDEASEVAKQVPDWVRLTRYLLDKLSEIQATLRHTAQRFGDCPRPFAWVSH